MNYWKKFQKEAEFDYNSKFIQFFLRPFSVSRYVFLTRFAFLINKTIPASAQLFFGGIIRGEFPEPVFSFMYLYHFVEEDLTFFLLKYLKPGMTFLDVGAHIGYFSMLASFLVGPNGQVHAFEVTPRTYKMLVTNVSHLKNVRTNLIAIWSKARVINFRDYGPIYAACNSFMEGKIAPKILKRLQLHIWKAKAISLDEYCLKNNIKPDFIKIDAESAEYEIIKGMVKTIKKYSPIISMEIGDKDFSMVKGSRESIKLLEAFGYIAFNFSNGKIVKHMLKDDYRWIFGNVVFLQK